VAEKEEKSQQVEIFTEYDPDYRVIATNFFWVGWTGLGDISVDFMIQNIQKPTSITYALPDGINIGDEIKRHPEGNRMVRRVQMGVLMTPDQALALSKILQDQVDAWKKAQPKLKKT